MNYSLRTPALNGETVTQGDADHCRENGHSTHTVDGIDQGICPRCGESTRKRPTRSAAHQKLIDTTAAKMTPLLLNVLKTMDEKPRAERTQEERLVYATVCDVLTERLGINDKVDELYEALPLELHMTGYEAIILAMEA